MIGSGDAGPCFDIAALERMLGDGLDDQEREAVEAHVEQCRVCQETLDQLTSGAVPAPAPVEAADFSGFLDRLKRQGPPPLDSGSSRLGSRRSGFGAITADADAADLSGFVGPPIAGFRLIREVGRGGMGTVYEAVELALGRRVALKVVANDGSGLSTRVERFRREARSAARLHHTNIVPVFGVGEDRGWLYYAMQFIDGEGLDGFISRLKHEAERPPGPTERGAIATAHAVPATAEQETVTALVPEAASTPTTATEAGPAPSGSATGTPRVAYRTAARIARQVAEALAFAHRHSIIHRDVKPSNILLDRSGDAWVADFGLAKSFEGEAEALTRTGDLVGTLRYMAPERFEGRSGVAGDIYALGATLYELLALRPAFEEPTRARLIERILREEPVKPRLIDRRIPRDLETIALKAMSKEPASRYASATEMAEDLRLYLAGEPIKARQVGPVERAIRWSRRNPTVAGLAWAVVLAVTIGFALTFWKWREAEHQRKLVVEAEAAISRERDQARQLAADLAIDRGLQFLARGESTEGRHWLAESLKTQGISPGSRRVAELNLEAWEDVCPRLIQVIVGPSKFESFSFGSDGLTVHALERDRQTLRHFDVGSGAERRPASRLPGIQKEGSDRVEFFGHGRSLWATHSSGKVFEIFDATTGETRGGPYPHDHAWDPLRVHKSPDHSAVAIAVASDAILTLDTVTGKPLGPEIRPGHPVGTRFAPGPGGKQLVTLGPEGAQFWDVATGRRGDNAPRISDQVDSVHFDPLAGLFTLETERPASGDLKLTTRFFNPQGQPRGEVRGQSLTWWNEAALTLFPGGEALAIGHRSGNVSLYNLEYGVQRGDALATEGPVSAMAVSPDGTTLVTGATDGRVQFWDSEGRPKFLAFPTLGSVRSLRYTSDGRGIGILLADGSIRIWRMPTRSLPTSRPLPVDLEGRRAIRDASFLPGSDHVLILAPQIQHARMLNSEGLPVADPLPFLWPNRRLIAADPTGQRWVTSSHGAGTLITEIRLYDANGKPIGNPLPHENWIAALAISPDGKTLAATGFAGRVWLYDAATGQPLKILRTGRINMSLAFSPDSKTLAVGTGPSTPTGETVQIQRWNVESGQLIKAVNMPDWTTSLTFSPDGRSLLARLDHEMTWSYFGKYQLLDVDSLQLRGEPLEGPTSVPGAVAFLPGNRLLTRGPDGLWEWDVIAGKASRLVIPLKDPVHSLKVSSGGRWLAILNDRGEGQTFDAATYRAIGPPLRAPKPLAGLAFAGDNRSIIGAVEDFSLRIWPLPDPESGTMTPGRPVDLELATGTELDPSTGAIPPLPILALTQRFQAAGPAREWMSDGDEARWHAESASSAEAAGNQFAALWHLDRLASFQPGNWSIQARRAGIFADRGQLDRASAELDQAAKTTPSVEALGNWIFGAAITARDTGRLVLARWYLDRLLRDSPQHILALVERSEIHARLGQVDQSDADLDRAIALGIDLSSVERTIDRLARAQRWDRAAALLKIVDHREPAFSEVLSSRRAIASLMANDLAGYRDACARMLARMPRSTGWMNAEESVYQCALAPQALTDFSLPIARVQQSLDATPSDRHSRRHYLLLFLGALQFRAGDPARARMTLLEAQKEAEGEEEPQDWAFLALTARALGKAEVSEYLKHLEAIRPSADPWDSAELWLLRKESRD